MDEEIGVELLLDPRAWPMAGQVWARQKFSRQHLPLLNHSLKIEHFAVFEPHAFQPDRISDWVVKRNAFDQTFARPIRVKKDSEIPSSVIEAVEHEQMPQFTLRNIGRYEMAIDLADPLPWQRVAGLGGESGDELRQLRLEKLPKVEPIQIWTVDYTKRMRNSLRRILIEDPWEMRIGPEATSTHDGLGRKFIVEGTHPDDLPGADWAPKLIPIPKEWVGPPPGEKAMAEKISMAEEIRRYSEAQ